MLIEEQALVEESDALQEEGLFAILDAQSSPADASPGDGFFVLIFTLWSHISCNMVNFLPTHPVRCSLTLF